MARRRVPIELVAAAGSLLVAAACSLDFDSFVYPDNVVNSASSSSTMSGGGGSGGELFTNSSSSTGMGGDGASGGGTGGAGANGGNGGNGGMGGCNDPNDCPQGGECESATCDMGMCGLEPSPIGDMCMTGGNICDGMGMCIDCQTDPVAALGAAMCPAECSSCDDTDNDMMPDECVFDCTGGGDPCPGVINCPAGFSCRVVCNQNNCLNFTVNCPAGEACDVTCNGGGGSCAGMVIACDQSSVCNLDCNNSACNNTTTLLCGPGRCGGECASNAPATLVCGQSCWCDAQANCLTQ